MSVIYRGVIGIAERILPKQVVDSALWNHPAGPKTVHFWAPSVKWALVIAGIGDAVRPAEKLSLYQSSALAATGCIWARYCLVIIPKNYYLCSVNVFVGLIGIGQLMRIANHRYQIKQQSAQS